jgi:hypothetical protein
MFKNYLFIIYESVYIENMEYICLNILSVKKSVFGKQPLTFLNVQKEVLGQDGSKA